MKKFSEFIIENNLDKEIARIEKKIGILNRQKEKDDCNKEELQELINKLEDKAKDLVNKH